jgi:hypothetical protein
MERSRIGAPTATAGSLQSIAVTRTIHKVMIFLYIITLLIATLITAQDSLSAQQQEPTTLSTIPSTLSPTPTLTAPQLTLTVTNTLPATETITPTPTPDVSQLCEEYARNCRNIECPFRQYEVECGNSLRELWTCKCGNVMSLSRGASLRGGGVVGALVAVLVLLE